MVVPLKYITRFVLTDRGPRMRRFGILAVAILSQIVLGGVAVADTVDAGKAVGVNPSASNISGAKTTTLVVGSDVLMGDKIVTGPNGQVQLIFNDDTHLVVGPGSALIVEKYLLRGKDKSVRQFAINSLSGTFRFITGKSDHSAYTINTPTGTIGVRGTAFDYLVEPKSKVVPGFDGRTWVALFRGAVQLCDLKGKCVTLSHQCDLGATSLTDSYTIGKVLAADGGARGSFRYIVSQKLLMQPFWVDESRRCFIDTNTNQTLPEAVISKGGGTPPCKARICNR